MMKISLALLTISLSLSGSLAYAQYYERNDSSYPALEEEEQSQETMYTTEAEQPEQQAPNMEEMSRAAVVMLFKTVDTNGDNQLSKPEVIEHETKKFELLDSNHDGQVSQEEMLNSMLQQIEAMKTVNQAQQ